MRISDWSSDVCSSDLAPAYAGLPTIAPAQGHGLFKADQDAGFYRKKRHHRNYSRDQRVNSNTRIWRGNDGRYRCKKDNGTTGLLIGGAVGGLAGHEQVGRASRRERVWQYV